MALFNPDNQTRSRRHKELAAVYELFFTLVAFAAAMMFLIGSWLFFYAEFETQAIWLFVIGSAFFAISPMVKLARELHYLAIGDLDDLARQKKQ